MYAFGGFGGGSDLYALDTGIMDDNRSDRELSRRRKRGGAGAGSDQGNELISWLAGLGLGKAIQAGRTAKKLTQKQLATSLNEKPQVIQQYENGQAIPNPQIIGKIERALGVKLPRPPKVQKPKD